MPLDTRPTRVQLFNPVGLSPWYKKVAQSADHRSTKKSSRDKISGLPDVNFLLQILEPCSNGALIKQRIGLEVQRLQHRRNFIIEDIGRRSQVQQDASQQMISGACKSRSDPALATWTHWTAAAAQKPQWASCPQVTTPALSRSVGTQEAPIHSGAHPRNNICWRVWTR